MIAVQPLACGIGAGRVVRALLDGVKGAGSGGDRPADSEATLLLDHQRIRFALSGFLCLRGSEKERRHQRERDDRFPTLPAHEISPLPLTSSNSRLLVP